MEAALLAILMAGVVALLMAGGRLVAAESAAEQAARAAARIATSARDAGSARDRAHRTAEATLAAQGLACSRLTVTVHTDAFAAPLGGTRLVRADVACTVRWSDLALPGAPGNRNVTASFTSSVDRFRERT